MSDQPPVNTPGVYAFSARLGAARGAFAFFAVGAAKWADDVVRLEPAIAVGTRALEPGDNAGELGERLRRERLAGETGDPGKLWLATPLDDGKALAPAGPL